MHMKYTCFTVFAPLIPTSTSFSVFIFPLPILLLSHPLVNPQPAALSFTSSQQNLTSIAFNSVKASPAIMIITVKLRYNRLLGTALKGPLYPK